MAAMTKSRDPRLGAAIGIDDRKSGLLLSLRVGLRYSQMQRDTLILKRASAARPCGEWDFDVLGDGVVGRIFKANATPD
jgi:hypothetical protein